MGAVVVALGILTAAAAAAAPPAPTLDTDTAYSADREPGTQKSSDADPTGDRPAAGPDVASAALGAARALADGTPGAALFGPHLVDELGYSPILEQLLPAKRTGDCSSPVPLPDDFEPACRVHDLGYDLLRVAHKHDTPIPPGLRSDLDTLLGRQMRASCDGRATCTVMAGIAETAVQINTVRQGHGAPVEERLPW